MRTKYGIPLSLHIDTAMLKECSSYTLTQPFTHLYLVDTDDGHVPASHGRRLVDSSVFSYPETQSSYLSTQW